MSGSGKHTAYKAFEDLGYFCVDNLPTPLISRLIRLSTVSGGKIEKVAIGVDVRLRESVASFERLFAELKQACYQSSIIFMDASNEVLARRYSETRRVHPLAQDRTLLEGVRIERRKLLYIRVLADLVIDTSQLSVHQLRNFIYEKFQPMKREDPPLLSVISFGFKYGLPYNSDLVFDVRFLPNPNFVSQLKSLTGNAPEVIQFMSQCPETAEIVTRIQSLLEYLLPKYSQEGKTYLTVSIGCTGGRHRSVVAANALKVALGKTGHRANVIHRDLHNG